VETREDCEYYPARSVSLEIDRTAGLSNIDSKAPLPQIPVDENYLDIDVVRADEATLRHVINRRAFDPTPIARASNIGGREARKIASLANGDASMFGCAV